MWNTTAIKKNNSLKYREVCAPDGLIVHVFGPMEGRRHDWTLFARRELDEQLSFILVVEGKQYYLYADNGYSERIYLQVRFQGDNLPDAQRAHDTAISLARVTVEWIFKEINLYWTTVDFIKRKMRVK